MKVGTNVFALALLAIILACGLSGCSNEEPSVTAQIEAHDPEAGNGDDQAKHGDAHTGGHKGQEHGTHDEHAKHAGHEHHGHKSGDHKHHGHGERHHKQSAPPQGKVKVGDKVPDFSVRTLDGKIVKLSELQKDQRRTKNGVVVLSFWCSTCHSCRDVEHLLAKLSKDYGGQAAVIALDANADETGEVVAEFLQENGLELPVVLDPSGSTADLFGVNRTTTTVVIDGDGVLRYLGQFRQKGGGSAEEALQAVLAGKEVTVKTTPHYG